MVIDVAEDSSICIVHLLYSHPQSGKHVVCGVDMGAYIDRVHIVIRESAA